MKKNKYSQYLFLFFLILFQVAANAQTLSGYDNKIDGMSFRGPYHPGFQTSSENDFWSETIDANIQGIKLAKQLGFKIFLKPHIILGSIPTPNVKILKTPGGLSVTKKTKALKDKTRGAKWRGTFMPRNQVDWLVWENSYENYILQLAHVADSLEVDLFCIGTELKKFVTKRPDFWENLIKKVRKIYDGPITYSANWDEYRQVPFWKELDYIAVNAYFPISKAKTPNIKKTVRKWKSTQRRLKSFSKKKNKQILFSEFGYRNVNFAGSRPWTHDRQDDKTPNNQAQVNLYEAFFKAFWDKPWVAGGFCWQWFHKPPNPENTTFSIQDKPALEVLQNWYKDEQ